MTAPTYAQWLRAEPEAVEYVTAILTKRNAFHKGSTDLRQAVATIQKRLKLPPTGGLSEAEFDRLIGKKPAPEEEATDDDTEA